MPDENHRLDIRNLWNRNLFINGARALHGRRQMSEVKINIMKPCTWTEEEKRAKLFAILIWMSPDIKTIDQMANDVDSYLDYILMLRRTKQGVYGNDFFDLDEQKLLEEFSKSIKAAEKNHVPKTDFRASGI